jgi:uncharacterized protein YndB with AHSA1/START domain
MDNNIKAVTIKKVFSRETSVSATISATPATVWELLTTSENYPNWNTTVISLSGKIEMGGKLKLKATMAPEREFNLTVKELVANTKLVWGDAMGNRVFALKSTPSGTVFSMTEKIGGPLFPLFAGMLPSFDEPFEKFAADLKRACEQTKK